jgi:hypothetical protein
MEKARRKRMPKIKPNAIESLLLPIETQYYNNTLYEKAWKHFDCYSEDVTSLFTIDDVEEYLFKSTAWLAKDPWLHAGVLKAKFPDGGSKTENIYSVEEFTELFASGHTLVIQSAQKRHPNLADFCDELSEESNCRVNANVYITPPNSQGFTAHYDMHDVFLLQTAGAKVWKVKPCKKVPLTVNDDRFREEYEEIDIEKDTEGSTEITLKAGQRLYMPRGTIHEGIALNDELSIHITFGIQPIVWDDIIMYLTSHPSHRDGNQLCESVPFEILRDLSSVRVKDEIRKRIALFNFDSIDQNISKFLFSRMNTIKPSNRFETINRINELSINSSIKIVKDVGIAIISKKYISFYGERRLIPAGYLSYLEQALKLNSFYLKELLGISEDNMEIIAFAKWLMTSGYAVINITEG